MSSRLRLQRRKALSEVQATLGETNQALPTVQPLIGPVSAGSVSPEVPAQEASRPSARRGFDVSRVSTLAPDVEMASGVSPTSVQRGGPVRAQAPEPRWTGSHLPMERVTAQTALAQRIRPAQVGGEALRPDGRTAQSGSERHLLPIQRDIKPGETLPDFATLTRKRIEKRVPLPLTVDPATALGDAKKFINDDDFISKVKGTYRPEEKDSAIRIIRQELLAASSVTDAQRVAGDRATELDQQRENREALAKARREERPNYGARFQFVDQFFLACQQTTDEDARNAVLDKRTALERGLTGRTIRETAISKTERAAFAAALKKMPFLQNMLASPTRTPTAGERAEWRGNARLKDDIREVTETGGQIRTDYDNGKLRQRVNEADEFIRRLVEPGLLAEISAPSIHVHMKYSDASLFNPRSWKDANTFRAFTSGTEVHLAQNEEKAIIVHEIGHYLEKNLPIEVWSDISKLILARDIQATGRPAASTKAVGSRGDPEEGGFAGEYPATGPYTSRAYTTGDTEVMSRTVELLSRPADTVKMIDKDPVQTALILRGLRPEEYAEMTELRPFDKYLPQAARWKEKKSKKRKTRKKGKEKEVA